VVQGRRRRRWYVGQANANERDLPFGARTRGARAPLAAAVRQYVRTLVFAST
jgi:hypothetical protein